MTSHPRITAAQAPALRHLLDAFPPHADEDFLDPDSPAEWALHYYDEAALGPISALPHQLADVLLQVQGDDAALAGRLGMFVPVPAGGTWHAWCRYLQAWLPQAWQQPELDPQAPEWGRLWRASRFTDPESANRAVTDVLRARQDRFRSWAAAPAGPPRLYLYADLGRELGTVKHRRGPDDPDGPVQPVTACAVLMGRDPHGDTPVVYAAYPEIALAPDAADRYPDLALLFGGYFGQDYDVLDGTRWAAERSFNTVTPAAVRDRVVGQLESLLGEPEEGIGAAIEALGCYVRPVQARRWVRGLHRRMTLVDWSDRA